MKMNNLETLLLLSDDYVAGIMEIMAQIGFLNDLIDNYSYFYEKTIDSSLSDMDRNSINENIQGTYSGMAFRARLISDEIDKVLAIQT